MKLKEISYHHFFQECGRRGGEKRAQRLSSQERSSIAIKAASTRWGHQPPPTRQMASFRLSQPSWDDPLYIEEILSKGSFSDWKQIYQRISDKPFGPTATALSKVLEATQIYGITPLWRGILLNLRGSFEKAP